LGSSESGSSGGAPFGVLQVTEADADRVIELFALAFYDDPTWSWAFPDPEQRHDQLRSLWGLAVHSAVAYGWVWMTDDGGAASLWIPPGEPELSEADEARLEPLIRELVGARADGVLALMDRFEANHPREQPHFYLSLLGTHPGHRGIGKGMRLLATNLATIDELNLPAYLESSNPVNDRRYEQLGFVGIGEFTAPGDGPRVGRMWRESR
jgi:GNAT superfamily N-acetyltransferase